MRLLDEKKSRIWLLYGDLAAGKTCFVKGVAEHFGVNPKKVKSPTFAFLNEYPDFIHYDLYRLNDLDELTEAQLNEHLEDKRLLLIEWPEKVEGLVEAYPHLKIRFAHKGEDQREIQVEECTA